MTNVLLIDDDPNDRAFAERALEAVRPPWAPARVTSATCWREAEPILHTQHFDLVLLDYHLPDLNGLGILRRLAEGPHPPVIMLTGQQDLATAVTTMRAGASDYVPKTVEPWGEALCLAVERVLEHDRMARELGAAQARLARYASDLEGQVALRTSELRAATAELARSNLDLERFAYTASHDLQEPLRRVEHYVLQARKRSEGVLDADTDRLLGSAADGAMRMQRLIGGLLEYSRAGSGLMMALTPCREMVAQVVNDLAGVIEEAGAVVEIATLPRVHADATQLARVFRNLIQNAIKFAAGDEPRVHVGCERTGDFWTFHVRDNGPGIDPVHHERVFEFGRRLPTPVARPGTGMGLAICRRVVEQHGGEISIESEPGMGATVVFTLPVEPLTTVATRRALARCERIEAGGEGLPVATAGSAGAVHAVG